MKLCLSVVSVDSKITPSLTVAAIMAAEERRKQKEQIKILKQQVGLLNACADKCFSCLSPYLSVLTHTASVSAAGNAEWLFCAALKLAFQLPLLPLLLNLLLFFWFFSVQPNRKRVVRKKIFI